MYDANDPSEVDTEFEASNLTFAPFMNIGEWYTVSFKVQLRDANFRGIKLLTPEVECEFKDSDNQYIITPKGTVTILVFVGDPTDFKLDQSITFKAGGSDEETAVSQPVSINIPGEEIAAVVLQDASKETLCIGEQQEDGTWLFSLETGSLEQAARYLVTFKDGKDPVYVPVTVTVEEEENDDPVIAIPDIPVYVPEVPTYDKVENAPEGGTVNVSLGRGEQVDAAALEALAGRDVTLEVKSGDVTLRLNGLDIPEGEELAPLEVRGVLGGDAVPAAAVDALAAGLESQTLSLEGQEDFGYTVEVMLSLPQQAGKYVNLYRYEADGAYGGEQDKKLVFQQSVLVPEDGQAALPMEKGGDYVMLFDEFSHETAFTDVSPSDWFQEEVRYVWRMGWMQGVEDGSFAPDLSLTRAQLMQILYNQAGRPEVAGGAGFGDVQEDDWYWAAVQWGAQLGVTQGYEDGAFRPDEAITREQLAVMLYRFHGGQGGSGAGSFTDWDEVDAWAAEAVEWAVGLGLLQGVGDGALAPRGDTTRAQSAAVLCRLAQSPAA